MTYIVYDFESTGTDVRFDQPTQFAAVVLDDNFNEIDSIDIRAKRLAGVIPAPGALATTGITGEQLDSEQQTHYDMMRQISEFIGKHTPAEVYGYNSVKFDEEMMRSSFRRTLQPMFQTTSNGNTRGDVINLATAVGILHPEQLKVPVKENGRESYKLVDITNANGVEFDEDSAHDALADVRATANFLKFLKEKDPAMFDRMHQNMTRDGAEKTLGESDVVVEGARYFGRAYSYAMTHLVQNPDYKAQHVMVDLAAIDEDKLAEIAEMSPEELKKEMNRSPKVLRKVKTNAHPAIAPYEEVSEGARKAFPPEEVLRERAAMVQETLAKHPTFKKNLEQALSTQYRVQKASPWRGEKLNTALVAQALPKDLGEVADLSAEELRDRLKGSLSKVLKEHGRAVDPDVLEAKAEETTTEPQKARKPKKPSKADAARDAQTKALEDTLRSNPHFLANLRDALSVDYAKEGSSPYVEARIYDGWTGRDDTNLMAYFHEMPWEERREVMQRFEDPDLAEIAREILYNQDPGYLTEEEQKAEQAKIASRFEAMMPEKRGVSMPRSVEIALDDGQRMLTPPPRSTKDPVKGEKKEMTLAAMEYIRSSFEDWEGPEPVPFKGVDPTTGLKANGQEPAAAKPAASHRRAPKGGWTDGLAADAPEAEAEKPAPKRKPAKKQDYGWKL